MAEQKLCIPTINETGGQITIKVNRKTDALLCDLQKRTGQSKSYLASRMIEFAYDFVEIEGRKNA